MEEGAHGGSHKLEEVTNWRKRKGECLKTISRMGEDELKEITGAVKERMEVVKPSKKKVKK